jgi:hypothetical protein
MVSQTAVLSRIRLYIVHISAMRIAVPSMIQLDLSDQELVR